MLKKRYSIIDIIFIIIGIFGGIFLAGRFLF
nr:MAG TPA: hypothetical protein [Caudoviricetes sp.]